ncbi:MAG: ATP-binding protein [Candidatus Aenigmatarchaeota archaeon]
MVLYGAVKEEDKKKQERFVEHQPFATIVGRIKEDQARFGMQGVGYIGKHIVGTGEDAHTTTKVLMDLLRPHIILVSGKRGTGKSYAAGVIIEELGMLSEEFRQNVAVVMIDTMGIFWSMKRSNDQQSELLRGWDLEPRGFDNVRVFVPFEQQEEFRKAGIPIDQGISILPYEFSAEEWSLAFNLKRTDQIGISLEKNINELIESGKKFTIEDIITKIRDDKETSKEAKDALENMLTVAGQWGVFGERGINIDDIVKPGQISVVDVSRLRATEAWSVRNFLVAILTRKIYQYRVLARKEEEVAKIEGLKGSGKKYPIVWLVIDEAHNFAPSDIETVSSAPILTIAKQGREPGVSMIVITQMPNKIHQDVLSQTDLVISHRLTSKADIDALHAVMQTYLLEDMWKYINQLPRWPGAAIILDDNLEKIFSVNIRPRISWHAGGTASVA